VLVGGPDFAYRGYEAELHRHATALGLDGVVRWLGDRADVPRLLAGLDALVRLSEDEGIPHVLAQAGAACLPVVATRDNGAAEQIADGRSGLFVPHRAPAAAAAARSRLVRDPALRTWLHRRLHADVVARYSVPAVLPQWRALLDGLTLVDSPSRRPPR
jgi:glycosyltransferase involved in cell wall biosynthesis